MMRKRLNIFVLVAGLIAGALAGVHAHAGGHDCPMKGMADDCCATAREHGGAPEVSAARLCCALNYTEPGTTGPTGAFSLLPTAASTLYTGADQPFAADYPYAAPPPRSNSSSSPPQDSHPAYIRHLALLI
ncbi:MAG: hypothetical protein LC802_15730 [Acidobacteria bacterium]|nr:hypothetical protein [Acidobacteriota bacterium]